MKTVKIIDINAYMENTTVLKDSKSEIPDAS